MKDIQSLFETNADTDDLVQARKLQDTVGLCLSGGGYRAMIYHVGALTRINELGLLQKISEIASVSGGSITAGVLALVWPRLAFAQDGHATNFEELVTKPLFLMARIGIDIRAILYGLLPGCSAADSIVRAYDRHLFHGASLQDIADAPRFTFMATNLQTGSAWRFAKEYAADYRVGRIERPQLSLARVVAASSAFPPLLSPVRIDLCDQIIVPMEGADLHRQPFIETAVLTDGGVYDNLGLERVWKRCRTILVSNAGRTLPEIGRPTGRWIGQTFRTVQVIHQQSENARRRLLFGMANQGQRAVAYWGVDMPIPSYGLSDALPLAIETSAIAAAMRTRLNPFKAEELEILFATGYAGADASIRVRGMADNKPAARLPDIPR